MLKVIWLSDLHFTSDGDVLGHDPRVWLKAAIDHVNDLHGDADFCVVSGDMVNRGTEVDYAALRSGLDRLTVPYHPMVGNHDNRALMAEFLPVPDTTLPVFVQYRIVTPEAVILCLDTQKAGVDAGEFCDVRSAWLRGELEAAGETAVYLFMHHPPHALGLPMQDADRLEGGAAFLDLVAAYDCIKYMFIGHVHRPISGVVRGVPFSTMRSVLYQASGPVPAWDWSTFKPGEEAPNIGVVTIEDGSVTLQFEQFCDYKQGVEGI